MWAIAMSQNLAPTKHQNQIDSKNILITWSGSGADSFAATAESSPRSLAATAMSLAVTNCEDILASSEAPKPFPVGNCLRGRTVFT